MEGYMVKKRKKQAAPPERNEALRDLSSQIEMLRELIELIHEAVDRDQPVNELLRLLDGLSKGSTRLAWLITTQQKLEEPEDTTQALSEALDRALERLRSEKGGSGER